MGLIKTSLLSLSYSPEDPTPFTFPPSLNHHPGLRVLSQGVFTTLSPLFPPNPLPHQLLRFHYCVLALLSDINKNYFEWTDKNPGKRPLFWATKLFTLVPITRNTTRSLHLTPTILDSKKASVAIPGLKWEDLTIPARRGFTPSSMYTDGYSASVVYVEEGKGNLSKFHK